MAWSDNADKDVSDDPNGRKNARISLLLVYVVGDFEIERIIRLGKGGIASPADHQFNLRYAGDP